MSRINLRFVYLITYLYLLLAALPLFGLYDDLNKYSSIREEVQRYMPIYTQKYGQSVKGVDYGVAILGGHIQKGGLGSTTRASFNGNNLLGSKNSQTAIGITVNGSLDDQLKFPLTENWESGEMPVGNANVTLKFETKELPVLPRRGMSKDSPELYQNTKVIYVTLKVEPLATKTVSEKEEATGWFEFDPSLRYDYENQVRALKNKYLAGKNLADMSEKELEDLARTMSAERREIGIKFKNATPEFLRAGIYARNMKKYGDKYGPTISYLRNVQGKSWKEIIDSASEPGGKDLWYITTPSYKLGELKNWFWGKKEK